MKAMVLAAGLGTRLRPLTDSLPKCLVEVGGMPLLELALRRLKNAGVSEAVVNAHHHADQVEMFLDAAASRLGLRLAFSREDPVLETGGGLKKAAWFFDDGESFLVCNADVVTDLDLGAFMAAHRRSGALGTLAVLDRATKRKLLFKDGRLVGREGHDGVVWAQEPVPGAEALAFSGMHAYSPELLGRLTEEGVFSFTKPWLRLAAEGARLAPYRHDGDLWIDIGTPEKLESARAAVVARGLPL